MFSYTMPKFKIKSKVKLIELFAGVGSQSTSLKRLNIDYESHKICEWETNAIASYKAIHMPNDDIDYSDCLSKEQLVNALFKMGISSDGKKSMNYKSISKKPDKWLRNTYNNIRATHNLVDITKVHASDLDITETNEYCYIMTYSFPCQDLSKAGKQMGMKKGSGTRSSLLWEVERILCELKESDSLPQILLMENVPDVIGMKNIENFNQWYTKLETIGYQSYYKILNAKDYGIPQNRERCFMVSILGNYSFDFPSKVPLQLKLKDMLENEVDEKYFVANEKIEYMLNTKFHQSSYDVVVQDGDVCATLCARDYKDPKCIVVGKTNFGKNDCVNRIYHTDGISPTIDTMQGGNRQPKIADVNICAIHGKNPDNPKSRKSGLPTKQMIEINTSGCSNALTTVQKDNCVIYQLPRGKNKGGEKEVCPTITSNSFQQNNFIAADIKYINNLKVRKLTPLECWRLMGFTDEDFCRAEKVNSNNQLYKQAGNSIVVNVLEEIFKTLF